MDKVTQDRIAKLHPSVREEVTQIVNDCDKALTGRAKIRLSQGLRTIPEQNALYAQGRTAKGPNVSKTRPMGATVTNAKGGQSIHNYGLAVDMVLIIDGKEASWDTVRDWDNDGVADWYECVKVFARYGWEWGGSWKSFKDLPHFEKNILNTKKGNLKVTWRTLQNMPKDSQGYVIF